jgi:hypothetical protein
MYEIASVLMLCPQYRQNHATWNSQYNAARASIAAGAKLLRVSFQAEEDSGEIAVTIFEGRIRLTQVQQRIFKSYLPRNTARPRASWTLRFF